jgi:hypothetical protein
VTADIDKLFQGLFRLTSCGNYESMIQDWAIWYGQFDNPGGPFGKGSSAEFIERTSSLTSVRPLHYASMIHQPELCAWPLKNGHVATQASDFGEPLHFAIMTTSAITQGHLFESHVECESVLLPLQPFPAPSQSTHPEYLLSTLPSYEHDSKAQGALDVIELLISSGANVKSPLGSRPLL